MITNLTNHGPTWRLAARLLLTHAALAAAGWTEMKKQQLWLFNLCVSDMSEQIMHCPKCCIKTAVFLREDDNCWVWFKLLSALVLKIGADLYSSGPELFWTRLWGSLAVPWGTVCFQSRNSILQFFIWHLGSFLWSLLLKEWYGYCKSRDTTSDGLFPSYRNTWSKIDKRTVSFLLWRT